jgi:prepilin-type N-terminal cleavage/methylation domain-containing protein
MVSLVEKVMIQILQTGTCEINSKFEIRNSKLRKTGFTLIELIVVIFIISFTMAIIMPSFWSTERDTLKIEAKRISSALRYIYDEAIGKKQTYMLSINLDNKSWSFESEKEFRSFRIKENVEIRDIVVPSLGEVSTGEVIIEFGPMGPEEPLILHLKKGKSEYSVIFNHLNGRTKIHEGYRL